MSSVSLLRLPNGADQRHEAISRAVKQASGLRFISWSGEQLLICLRCQAPCYFDEATQPPALSKPPHLEDALIRGPVSACRPLENCPDLTRRPYAHIESSGPRLLFLE